MLEKIQIFLGIVIMVAIIIGIYYAYQITTGAIRDVAGVTKSIGKAVTGAVKTVGETAEQVFKPVAATCPLGYRNAAGICYENCDGKWDGTYGCYENPSQLFLSKNGWSRWPGSNSLTHLQHDTKYSPVGLNGVPTGCPPGQEKHAGLCYALPGSEVDPADGQTRNYTYSSPGLYRLPCPPGMRWDGTACWRDYRADGRGVGVVGGKVRNYGCPSGYTHRGVYGAGWCTKGLSIKGETESWKPQDQIPYSLSSGNRVPDPGVGNRVWEKCGALYYPKCPSGFTTTGCNLCVINAKAYYSRLKSVIGKIPAECEWGKVKKGALCYDKCPIGYERRNDMLEHCSTVCPPGYTNIGAGGCQRPRRELKSSVPNTCPPSHPLLRGLLCYQKQ